MGRQKESKNLTPMMAQYRRIKSQLPPNTLLLFRLGDFYEMFYEDAKIGAQVLNIALTRRGPAPMCGIPYHAAGTYISKLLKAGHRVAICDQVEEAKPGKLVKREVTQILSPGAHLDEQLLSSDRHNFLAAVHRSGRTYGLALLDLSTGEFYASEFPTLDALTAELYRNAPAEILIPSETQDLQQLTAQLPSTVAHEYEAWTFLPDVAETTLKEHFGVATLDGFGLGNRPAAIGAAGAILYYLKNELRRDLTHVRSLRFLAGEGFLQLDPHTLRNLEILEPISPHAPRNASLYGVLNRCVTPMGARRLRQWLARPAGDLTTIHERLDTIDALLQHPELLDDLRKTLSEIRDLERTLARLSAGQAGPRDVVALRTALRQLPALREILWRLLTETQREWLLTGTEGTRRDPTSARQEDPHTRLLRRHLDAVEPQPDLVDLLERALVEDPPATLKEGGVIRPGFDPQLDELRSAAREGKQWIAQLQQREIERTGIQSLKIRFNAVFGYFIEVTKANLDKVPPDYIRKQTIANGERFITPELKEMEAKILGAEERAVRLEQELFQNLRAQIIDRLGPIQRTAHALAELDVLASLAETARLYNYCRPTVQDQGRLEIRDGRHPVLEQVQLEGHFVPNDTELNDQIQIAIITGPNMAGKSTYIRQVALITIMAHIGSFVPARSARIDLVDRIFTRIGASDDLARGQSTFMVEMSETAEILHHATPKSLIILDEVGRGTSTFDGLSLAWSIVEHLHNVVHAKTLFATHYHELTELEGRLPRVKNYNVAVREWKDQIVFLHKIVEGAADKSYGIQVARLAGVPEPIIQRARQILRNLEEAELTPDGKVRPISRHRRTRQTLKEVPPPAQLDLFAGMEF